VGILPNLHCPHYNERPEFDDYIQKAISTSALAVDDNCAVVFQDDSYRIIRSDDSSKAILLTNKDDVVKRRIIDNAEFTSINNLK